MAIVQSSRRASIDEIAAEMDRRGEVIDALQKEIEVLRAAAKPAGNLGLLYEIRAAMGWTDKHSLSLMPSGVAEMRQENDRLRTKRGEATGQYPVGYPGGFDGPTAAD